ncbi:MAG TPA: chloride channel protein, partial [Tepidisphaeraceae bacterium]|nr:chloride channel protein [Tepidisphaeraceae bacterium]
NVSDFASPHLQVLRATVLPGYLLLGLVAGVFGVAFNVSLLGALRLSDRLDRWPRGAKGAVVGAAAGGLAWFIPHVVGGGEVLARSAIEHPFPWPLLIGLLAARFILTVASYGSGAPGGIFAPLLALGALLGSGYAVAQGAITGHMPEVAPYVIVSMAACFTSVVRSPLTGVVLLLEMTGSWPLILPMMAASITAYAVPELLGNPPVYDSLRERDEQKERADRAASA